MNYPLLKDIIALVERFEKAAGQEVYSTDLNGFKHWVSDEFINGSASFSEPDWEGKEKGRSPESVISTLIVHMNRYARTYSKSAIYGSDFSTQDEFIYLINLRAFGAMSKMELIKKNIQDKPTGMQIINRLIQQGWVEQRGSETDKRAKIISITLSGSEVLEKQMDKIRQATVLVTGRLTHPEKMELIRLLNKLNDFHLPLFSQNLSPSELLENAMNSYLKNDLQ